MSTKLELKTWRTRFNPLVVNLLVGVVVVLVLGGLTAQAQNNTTMIAPAADLSAPVESSIVVSASGTISDPSGAIPVSGKVTVTCRRIVDSTGASSPIVVLDFDFTNLQGSTGNGKSQKVYITGGNHANEIRPLQASDKIIVTAPYYDSALDAMSARSMLVTADLNFDVSTGKLTGGSITVGTNVITAESVGTMVVM